MFSKEMEALIEATLEDGVLTDQEKAVLVRRAQKEGIDVDELDVYIQSLLQKRKNAQTKQEMDEAKASTFGNLRRCVRCGAVIPLGAAACPDCGLTLENNATGNAVELLQKGLMDLDKEWKERTKNKTGFFSTLSKETIDRDFCQQKLSFVTSFMVPNNRADLLQLLAFTKPKAKKNGPKDGMDASRLSDLSYAYWVLFESCVHLASASFANDPAFKVYFDFYETEKNKKSLFARLLGKFGI